MATRPKQKNAPAFLFDLDGTLVIRGQERQHGPPPNGFAFLVSQPESDPHVL